MFEKPVDIAAIPEKPSRPYFDQPNASKEFVAAKNFAEKYVDTGKFAHPLTDTPENMQVLLQEVTRLGNRLFPGNTPEGVLVELKKAGVVTPFIAEKVTKEKPVEFIPTQQAFVQEFKEVDLTEEQQATLEANILFEEQQQQIREAKMLMDEMDRANVFDDPEERERLYQNIIETEKNTLENEVYYYEFSKKGLIKGGDKEVADDIESLKKAKEDFKEEKIEDLKERERVHAMYQVAKLTEAALAEGVEKFGWYGESVTIQSASEFDDVKRGVDDVMEIRREDDESSFLALGIDVTFRGLYSAEFKNKFTTLLESIKRGHKTKVKYFKNHNGEMKREFAIPKMVLYFNADDVKDMVNILKYSNKESLREEFENSPQKFNVMGQVIHSCKILAGFAEGCRNSIFKEYDMALSSLKELAWENPAIKEMLETPPDGEVLKYFDSLIQEFKENEKGN